MKEGWAQQMLFAASDISAVAQPLRTATYQRHDIARERLCSAYLAAVGTSLPALASSTFICSGISPRRRRHSICDVLFSKSTYLRET